MKRTYVDIIGEYYDSLDDLIVDAGRFGVRGADLIKVLSGKKYPENKILKMNKSIKEGE